MEKRIIKMNLFINCHKLKTKVNYQLVENILKKTITNINLFLLI